MMQTSLPAEVAQARNARKGSSTRRIPRREFASISEGSSDRIPNASRGS